MKESEVLNLSAGVLAGVPSEVPQRPGYLDASLALRTPRPYIENLRCSLSTPQLGAADPEILTPSQPASIIAELRQLQQKHRLLDMPDSVIDEIAYPPRGPDEFVFAGTTILAPLTDGRVFIASHRFGKTWGQLQNSFSPEPIPPPQSAPFRIP